MGIDQNGRRSARSNVFSVRPRWQPSRVAVDVYGDRYFLRDGMMVLSPDNNYRGMLHRYARGAADLDIGADGTLVFLSPAGTRKVEGVDIELKDRVMVVNSNTFTRWFSMSDRPPG